MLQVVIIGSGNVAQHLIKAFGTIAQAQLVQAFARHPDQLATLLPPEKITNSLNNLAEADVYIIAVKDDAITDVSSQLPFKGKLVVHTSGSMDLGQIDNKNRRGVFYPLQTFSKNKTVDFTTVPLCLESEFEENYAVLELLAKALSNSVYRISSEQRQSLHVAAVFASNFSNHMYALSSQICQQNNIPFGILNPLIEETAGKIKSLSPVKAQTGPAVRNDRKTIQKHLDFLTDENQKAIYKLLTQSIQQTNEQEL
ncbi:Rossmann-like and DUF2520 domain-containing protein [Flavobacterium subsaxonicum]|uniref:DUF2520 domain-containing protein n=1 Tax=Flavobacterium subsaxonicum WB 4.1-42 = DSM 21790 TaxID=1121898 RepID=A0A0A2MTE9_9FLAO|nr:Rossmann-like and DUF2520 domain-containing protein [Flavobacterium subsaxonicum]KGO94871.1 hypothetical protein Q766_01780 [Flavobacterium subsaxonicum WB 4.1-42 = DSM 21790]